MPIEVISDRYLRGWMVVLDSLLFYCSLAASFLYMIWQGTSSEVLGKDVALFIYFFNFFF
jgi:hypothetical protein